VLKERQLDPVCSGISLAYKLFDAPSPNLALRQCFAAGGAPATDFSSRRQLFMPFGRRILPNSTLMVPTSPLPSATAAWGFPSLATSNSRDRNRPRPAIAAYTTARNLAVQMRNPTLVQLLTNSLGEEQNATQLLD
jgi:hypothetical protein